MSDAATPAAGHNVGGVSADRLISLVERHERLDEEVKALRSDQKDILLEAKSAGYDLPALRQVLRLRKMDSDKRQSLDDMVELYRRVLGL